MPESDPPEKQDETLPSSSPQAGFNLSHHRRQASRLSGSVGAILVILCTCVIFGIYAQGSGLGTPILFVVAGFFMAAGITLFVCSRYIEKEGRVPVILALVLASAVELFLILNLLGTLIATIASGGALVNLITLFLLAVLLIAFAYLIYHLIRVLAEPRAET